MNAALKIKCPNQSGVSETVVYQENPTTWQHVRVEINIDAQKKGTFNTYIGTDTTAHKSGKQVVQQNSKKEIKAAVKRLNICSPPFCYSYAMKQQGCS